MKKIAQKLKLRWKSIILILVIFGVVGWVLYSRQKTEILEVTFVSPERGDLIKTLEVNGVINAKEYARLRFANGGKLTYLGAKEGDVVTRGQTIATIDQSSLQKSLQKSLNLSDSERLDWEQTQDDIKDRWIPQSEERSVSQEELDLKNTVLDVELSTIAIQNTRLTSPIAGVLVASPTQLSGVVLSPTDTFEVVNPGSLIFQAYVDEADISQVSNQQSAQIFLDAYPDHEITSAVNYISYKSAQTSAGTVFVVEFPIIQPNLNTYRIGMNGDATIILEKKQNVLSIPIDSTIERDDTFFVQVRLDDGTTIDREIQVGMETDDRIEVLSGLSESDQIVLP